MKEDKAEYIQALIDTREQEDIDIFLDCMTRLHCQHLKADIDHYMSSTAEKMVNLNTLPMRVRARDIVKRNTVHPCTPCTQKSIKSE